MDHRGNIEDQEWGVAVDEAAGDLVVTVNGQTFLRLGLPLSVWADLRASAGRRIEAAEAERADIFVGETHTIEGDRESFRPADPAAPSGSTIAATPDEESLWFYEQKSGGGWSPVASGDKPRLKGDRLSGEYGPDVRNVRRISVWHHHLRLAELQAVYGGNPA